MVTIIMFLIFSKANFFLAILMIGGGVAADIFLFRRCKPMLQEKGILPTADKNKTIGVAPSKEEYIKKTPLTDPELLVLADRYNNYAEDEGAFDFFFSYYVEHMPNIKALTANGEEVDSTLAIIMAIRAKTVFDEVFHGHIDNPMDSLNFIDGALDITCGTLFTFAGKLNHCLFGLTARYIAQAVTLSYVDPSEDWLYDKAFFSETPETDPEGKKMVENIRPMLEAAGFPLEDE